MNHLGANTAVFAVFRVEPVGYFTVLLPPLSPCSDACAILDDINGDTPKLDASKERVMHICKAIVQ